ncbi:MAG: hypothetical protein QM817_04295 [Archangium sp.]
MNLFVGTTPGLERALGEELAALGYSGDLVSGGVETEGDYRLINLWSRIASRVLIRVREVGSIGELQKLDLSMYGDAFEIDAFGEDAAKWGGALASKIGAPKLILRGLKRGGCQVSIDTTGELLHFRGYRQEVGRAPMRETLAAGVLQLSKWKPGEPLWDVMCGSGTILDRSGGARGGPRSGSQSQLRVRAVPLA